MKLGTSVFLLVIILIAFGYVMSDDQHVRTDLKDASVQIEGLNAQVLDVNGRLNSCQKTVQDDQQIISQQRTEITSLHNMISVKDDQIGSLQAVIAQQSGRITQLENSLAKSSEENTKLQTVQSAGALQVDPVVVGVILVVQLVLFIIQQRHKKDYVRLSGEERALIINLRRRKKM